MMTHSPTDIWSQVLNLVREELDNPDYNYLLEGTRAIRAEEGTLTVSVPTKFARDWLEARLLPELEELLYNTTGRTWRLLLVDSTGSAPGNSGGSANGANAASSENGKTPMQRDTPGQQRLSFSSSSENAKPRLTAEVAGGTLNSRYTFDTFVVGKANHFAHAAALAVAEEPGFVYNPLFLYGGVGLGKTHLMHAVGHYALENHKGMHVVYVSSERFTNDMVNSIMNKSMTEFRNKYRQADILLIDDIQFVAGKEQTQEEIFHTFNALYEENKQIVISSDRQPREIPTLEDRLRSRFEWGLIADIQAPDLETRVAILRKKALAEGYSTPNEVLTFIAKHVQSNIRELEGALIRVMAYADLHAKPVTPELALEALKDMVSASPVRLITISLIQEIVSEHFGVKVVDMRSKKRTREVAFPRQVAMYLARELTDASLPRIGEDFGGRDHTTVMHACEKIRGESEYDQNLAATLRELRTRLQSS